MNHYQKEEDVKETPNISLDNYDAGMKAIKLNVAGIKQWRADTEMFLGALYEQAVQANDEAAMTSISVTWARDQQISDEFIKMMALQKSLRKMVQQLLEGSQVAHDALEELEEAIADVDEEHHGLEDFAYQVRRKERERVYPIALHKATTAVMQEFYDKLRAITGRENTDFAAIHRLMNLLTLAKDYEPSDLQRALIVELVNTCAEDVAPQEAAHAAR